jgi:hypothetical protein
MWWQLAVAGAQIIGGVSARAKAKHAARQNAQFIKMENMEVMRRMDREQKFRLGSAIATLGAGGVLNKGSAAAAIKGLEDEYARQREWAVQAGEQRRKAALAGANGVGEAAMLTGLTTAAYAFSTPSNGNNGKRSSGWRAQSQQTDYMRDYNQGFA